MASELKPLQTLKEDKSPTGHIFEIILLLPALSISHADLVIEWKEVFEIINLIFCRSTTKDWKLN